MNRKTARRTLEAVFNAAQSEKPITNICAVLGMDPDWFESTQDFQDAFLVRIAELRRKAGL